MGDMEKRVSEIRARLDAATPRPWKATHVARLQYGTPIHGPFGSAPRPDEGNHIANAFSDAEFIARAPDDIAFLLDLLESDVELTRLEKENEWLQDGRNDLLLKLQAANEATQFCHDNHPVRVDAETQPKEPQT